MSAEENKAAVRRAHELINARDLDALPSSHPAFGKSAGAGATAYVCRRQVCGMPISDAHTLASALAARG